MAISFFQQSGKVFHVKQKKTIKHIVQQMVASQNCVLNDINIVLMNDNDLLSINKEHLKHDYYTDIITFNYNEGFSIAGDLFISIDRIRENAGKFAVPVEAELYRIIIHGVLHLIGFNDKDPKQKLEMTEQENIWLDKLNKMFHVKQNK